jgi:hypothetical protein
LFFSLVLLYLLVSIFSFVVFPLFSFPSFLFTPLLFSPLLFSSLLFSSLLFFSLPTSQSIMAFRNTRVGAAESAEAVETEQKSNSSLWKWVAVGVAAVGAAAYYAVKSSSSTNDNNAVKAVTAASSGAGVAAPAERAAAHASVVSAQEKKTNSAAGAVPLMSPAVQREVMNVNMLIQKLSQDQNTEDPNQLSLLQRIRSIQPQTESALLLVAMTNWLITYHTFRQFGATTPESAKKISDEQMADMRIAWDMLDFGTDISLPPDVESGSLLLRLDIAQRLRDSEKVVGEFEKLVVQANDSKDNFQNVIMAFTNAPIVGRWSMVKKLGDMIHNHDARGLHSLHLSAINRPDIPDYEVLHSISEREAAIGDLSTEDIKWCSLVFQSYKLRVKEVQASTEAKRSQVRKAFDPSDSGDWQDAPVGGKMQLVRVGAIVQMVSMSTIPLPLVGSIRKDRIYMEGYADVQGETEPDANGNKTTDHFRQREQYEVKRVEDDTLEAGFSKWRGTYKFLQAKFPTGSKVVDESSPEVGVDFDVEFVLKEDEMLSVAANAPGQ